MPVHGGVVAAEKITSCIHCGQADRSLERRPKKLLAYIGTLLALALLVLLCIAVGRQSGCLAREGVELPFMEVFGKGRHAFLNGHEYNTVFMAHFTSESQAEMLLISAPSSNKTSRIYRGPQIHPPRPIRRHLG